MSSREVATLQSLALLGLYALGQRPAAAIVLIAVAGLAFAGFTASLGGLVLQVAPGRSDLAAATVSAAVNVGITGGAFASGLALPSYGVHSTVLIGALLGIVALVMAIGERLVPSAADRRAPSQAARSSGEVAHGSPMVGRRRW